MLLLFTSGTRPRYIEDVLDVLNLPINALTTIQYTLKYEKAHGEYDSYVQDAALPKNCIADEDVMVIFINRDDSSDYKYIPLRKCRYVSGEVHEGMAYYTIELGEICAVKSIERFSEYLKGAADVYLYKHPEHRAREGYYVFRINEDVSAHIDQDDAPWRTTTEYVAKCHCFKDIFPVFTQFNLFEADQETETQIKRRNNKSYYLLKYGCQYTAKIDYYIPDARINTNKITASTEIVTIPDVLESTSTTLNFGAEHGMVKYTFRVKEVSNRIELKFHEAERTGNKQPLFITTRPISMRAVRTKWRWILILGVLGLMLLCDVLNQFPIEDTITRLNAELPENLSLIQHWQLLLAYLLRATEALYPALISSIKSWLTLLMVLLYGKKEL